MGTMPIEQVAQNFQHRAEVCRMLGEGFGSMGMVPLATSFCEAAEVLEDLSEQVLETDPSRPQA